MVGRCGGDRRLCGGGTEDVAGLDDEDESGRDAAVKDVQGEEAAEGVDAPVFRGGDGIGGPGGARAADAGESKNACPEADGVSNPVRWLPEPS